MKLLTEELKQEFAKVGRQEHVEFPDKICVAKYFDPCGSWTWYATECYAVFEDGEELEIGNYLISKDPREAVDYHFFGLVVGFENEWGYFSLEELESVKGPLGIGLERDLYCGTPKKMREFPALEEVLQV